MVDGEEDIIEAGGVVEPLLDFRGDLPPPVEPGQLQDVEVQPSEEQRLSPRPQVEPLINPLRDLRPQVEQGQLRDMEVQPSEK